MSTRMALISAAGLLLTASAAPSQVSFTATTYPNNLWNNNLQIDGHVKADLNGDGREDFISLNDDGFASGCAGSFAVTLSKGDGTYNTPVCYTIPSGDPLYFAVGDFFNDGLMDVVVANDSGSAFMYHNNGAGALALSNTFALQGVPGGMVAADVNHDGSTDLIYDIAYANGTNTLNVLLGDGAGAFPHSGPTTTFTMNKEPAGALSIGDFDNDSKVDILVLGASQVGNEILWGNGEGGFTQGPIVGGTPPQYVDYAAYSLHSNGTMDLIGAPFTSNPYGANTYYNTLNIQLGHSDRALTSQTVTLKQCTASSSPPAVADFNGDGIADIAVVEASDCQGDGPYTLNVMLGNADGSFQPEQIVYTSSDWIYEWRVLRASQNSKPDLVLFQAAESQNQISNLQQVVLVNTTSGGFPSCSPNNFLSTGIDICAPVAETGLTSPVTFSFGGANQSAGRDMELWIDGEKVNENLKQTYSYYDFLTASVPLSEGPHTVTAYAVGWDYSLESTTFDVYVGSSVCPPPSSDGVNICSPIGSPRATATLTSPVLAQASGNVSGSGNIVRMEVWVDGVKEYSTFGSNALKTYLNLPPGFHRFDYYIVASDGNQFEDTVYGVVR